MIGCGIVLLDESLKILLPGREFAGSDLVRDWLGVVIAAVVIQVISQIKLQHARRKPDSIER